MIKVVKSLIVTVAFLIMVAVLVFIDSGSVIDIMAGAYLAAVSAYLGVDIRAMIKSTAEKKKGNFEKLNAYKYVICFLEMGVLAGLAIWRKEVDGVSFSAAVGMLGAGCILIIGMVLGGLEGNKAATMKEGDDEL